MENHELIEKEAKRFNELIPIGDDRGVHFLHCVLFIYFVWFSIFIYWISFLSLFSWLPRVASSIAEPHGRHATTIVNILQVSDLSYIKQNALWPVSSQATSLISSSSLLHLHLHQRRPRPSPSHTHTPQYLPPNPNLRSITPGIATATA